MQDNMMSMLNIENEEDLQQYLPPSEFLPCRFFNRNSRDGSRTEDDLLEIPTCSAES
ncbi:hypothetical protein SNEBB_001135, partial [Seison nebaliae]